MTGIPSSHIGGGRLGQDPQYNEAPRMADREAIMAIMRMCNPTLHMADLGVNKVEEAGTTTIGGPRIERGNRQDPGRFRKGV